MNNFNDNSSKVNFGSNYINHNIPPAPKKILVFPSNK